jgi:von Willebrand factor type D domain
VRRSVAPDCRATRRPRSPCRGRRCAAERAGFSAGRREWDPDEHCDDDQPDQGSSNGDPPLLSFDGLPFDVISLGEFVLARDPAGDMEVQTRHVPLGFGTGTTAVALGDGSHRVTLTMQEFFAVGSPAVRVDGAVVTDPEFLAGELRVTVGDEDSTVIWPDGSTAALHWYLGWFVTVTVPDERATRMEGLLGAADGDLRNDLRLPDGTTVDTNDAAADESPYSLAWAVDDATTLFDYAPGESVATFRIPHPSTEPPALDEQSTDVCASALGAEATAHDVHSCAYDVSATGEDGFVDEYVDVVEDRDVAPTLGEPLLVRPTTEPPQTATPAAEGVAGRPALTLSATQPAGSVDAAAGTVMLAMAAPCSGLNVSIEVTAVDGAGGARASLCDPQELGEIGLDDDDEYLVGEAYVWLPADGPFNVELATTLGDAEALGEVAVYIDPSPLVADAAALADGERSTLSVLGDTVVYLPDPAATFDAVGLDVACAVEVWSGEAFPDPEPRDLGACQHTSGIDFPPTDTVVPVVVFNRTGDEITVELTPAN